MTLEMVIFSAGLPDSEIWSNIMIEYWIFSGSGLDCRAFAHCSSSCLLCLVTMCLVTMDERNSFSY